MFGMTFTGLTIGQMEPWFRDLTAVPDDLVHRVATRVAELFLQRLKDNWYGQSLPLIPLSLAYLAKKKEKGLDQRILIATGELVAQLSIFDEPPDVVVA